MAWNRYEDERRSRGYSEPDYDRYGRSERDRGMVERGADEVRSWIGDEEAEQRRRRDREAREGRLTRTRADSGAGDYGYQDTRASQSGRAPEWRDIDSGDGNAFETGRSRSAQRSSGQYVPATFSYMEIWAVPGPHAGQGPRGYQRSDERIKEDVCECLAQHGQIDARNIDVTVENGEVTLRGSVDERNMKRRAEDAAESISGVRDVHNEIRVNASDAKGQSGQPRIGDGKNEADQSGRQTKSRANT